MAKVSVSEAVQLTGIPKSNIYRDISDGKVSATTDDKNKKVIDTAELARVYGDLQYPMQSENGKDGTPTWDDLGQNGTTGKKENPNRNDANNKVIAVLEEQVALLKQQLENATERETKLMDMLTAEQEKTRMLMLPAATSKRRSTWRRFFRLT